MSLEKLFDINPQIIDEKQGAEPALRGIIFRYYYSHFKEQKAADLTNEYISKLTE